MAYREKVGPWEKKPIDPTCKLCRPTGNVSPNFLKFLPQLSEERDKSNCSFTSSDPLFSKILHSSCGSFEKCQRFLTFFAPFFIFGIHWKNRRLKRCARLFPCSLRPCSKAAVHNRKIKFYRFESYVQNKNGLQNKFWQNLSRVHFGILCLSFCLNCLDQGCTTFCYCRPHYFYLYEVRPPMSSSYIYEIRLIKDKVLSGICHLLLPKSIIKRQIFQRIFYEITHRVDWFSCVAFVFVNIRQHGRQVLYFKLHVDGRKFHYRRPQVVHRWLRQSFRKPSSSKFNNCCSLKLVVLNFLWNMSAKSQCKKYRVSPVSNGKSQLQTNYSARKTRDTKMA